MHHYIKKIGLLITLVGAWMWPIVAQAHEAYVLPQDFFWQQITKPINPLAFEALRNPTNLKVTLFISIGVIIVFLLNFLFRLSWIGQKFNQSFEKLSNFGPVFVRIAIAAAFYFGAKSNAFLGPELPLAHMPLPHLMQWGLYIISAMILLGIFTEIAAIVGLIIFSIGFFAFGAYLATYLNYLGELIILVLFGMRRFSFDKLLFGPLKNWRAKWEPYETTIIRVFYGAALIVAGITVKFLHPELTLRVINDWNLTQFHWLFPHDPLLVVLGGGLAEATIGLFIILGFEIRLTVLISLFYITLSLGFFRELVWPHILLYGISFNLLVQPEIFTLDHLFFKKHRDFKSIWQRLISSHRNLPTDINNSNS